MTLLLYHHNSSVCAAKVRVTLHEKRLEWDGKLMTLKGDQFDPSYLELNPAAVVPTLVHDDVVVTESNVILEYLDDVFSDPSLRPQDSVERAQMRYWMQHLDNGNEGIHHAVSVLTYGVAYRHQVIEDAGSQDPDRLRDIIKRQMNPKSRTWLEDVVIKGTASKSFQMAVWRIRTLLGDFESNLVERDWLAGSCYSLADIAFTSYFYRLQLMSFDRMWAGLPRVSNWYDRLVGRESMAAVVDWYRPDYRQLLLDKGREICEIVEELTA